MRTQRDLLIETAFVKLTGEQEDYLSLYMDMDRPQLFREFRKRFSSNINKIQFNFALMNLREATEAPPPRRKKAVHHNYTKPDVVKAKNVYWIADQGVWIVKFKKKGKEKRIGSFRGHEEAKRAADKYRKSLA